MIVIVMTTRANLGRARAIATTMTHGRSDAVLETTGKSQTDTDRIAIMIPAGPTPPPALECDPEGGPGVVHVSVPRVSCRCRCGAALVSDRGPSRGQKARVVRLRVSSGRMMHDRDGM